MVVESTTPSIVYETLPYVVPRCKPLKPHQCAATEKANTQLAQPFRATNMITSRISGAQPMTTASEATRYCYLSKPIAVFTVPASRVPARVYRGASRPRCRPTPLKLFITEAVSKKKWPRVRPASKARRQAPPPLLRHL